VINKWKIVWKEAVLAYFEVISWHLPGKTVDNQCPDQNLNVEHTQNGKPG
jgi:hypothetical protein